MSSKNLLTPVAGLLALCGVLVAWQVGCSSFKLKGKLAEFFPEDSAKPGAKKKDPAGTPKLDVAGENLGESQEVSASGQELARVVDELLGSKRHMSASRWILRHPDAALETLRNPAATQTSPLVLDTIARAHDRQTLRAQTGPSWQRVMKQRQSRPEPFAEYDQARAKLLSLAAEGESEKAARLNLPGLAAKLGEPLVEIDAWQLQGTAMLLCDKPRDAVAAWQKALSLAQPISDYQTAYLLLLLSDAQRRSGDVQEASATWLKGVNVALGTLSASGAICDPVLWERLAYMRPVQVEWPDAVVRRLRELDPIPGLESTTGPALAEACLWSCVGKWYLDRGHYQAGLVAFKRSESALSEKLAQQSLRFRQARALILLNQTGAGTAVLIALANDKVSPMARPAMGMLGSLRLQSGNVQQGANLLRKAVEKNESFDWPERPSVEADLGLAFLMLGDEARGLKWLHQAQQRFEARQEYESLALSLQNEAAYFADAKQRSEADTVRRRLADLERQ